MRKKFTKRERHPYLQGWLCKTCRFLQRKKDSDFCGMAKLEIENLSKRSEVCGCWNWQDKNAENILLNLRFEEE